ncbi:MAG TPA: GNAT family N-acetyltransferase [Gaiellales bacterium]|nr:GNAT family N-acetyltransferase [Gaiellales bacterium]
MRIERVTDAAGVEAAGPLLDRPPAADATRRFLADPGHHLLVAYEADVPAGFVTGVEMTHPDKGTEMFLYELGVSEGLRSRGIGRSLVAALAQLARDRGCYGMWVLTGPGNAAAQTAYSAAGGVREADQAFITWTFTTAAG